MPSWGPSWRIGGRIGAILGQACISTTAQLVYDGYIYRTLSGAPVDGPTTDTTEEQTYMAMPAGYTVAPDDASVVANVIATHTWDAWRICTQTKTWSGLHYGGGAGLDRTEHPVLSPNWETDGQGQYRIIPGTPAYTRLLIRTPCEAPPARRRRRGRMRRRRRRRGEAEAEEKEEADQNEMDGGEVDGNDDGFA